MTVSFPGGWRTFAGATFDVRQSQCTEFSVAVRKIGSRLGEIIQVCLKMHIHVRYIRSCLTKLNCRDTKQAFSSAVCRLEALRWIHFLLQRNQSQVLLQLSTLLPALLDAVSATSEAVVMTSLSVLAAIAACPQQFR